ncbi:MAG: methyltransferase domain-containing protein [Phycisphaerales bacterium]|nr:MAG: methyltransferase domain-containing protein [Phycisphaerales bacterium]
MQTLDSSTVQATETPPISIVVIGRNEGARLLRCLNSICEADFPRHQLEVIYVDTASTDGSAKRAEPLADRVVQIRPARPSAAAARNAGWQVARHELVQFLDGDTVLHRDWLRTAVRAIRIPHVFCVSGRREEADPQRSVVRYWVHRDWCIPPGLQRVCGGDAMFQRITLIDLGGYDETLIAGEEPDLCLRAVRAHKGRVLSLDVPMTVHDIGELTLRQYCRRCVRTGHAYAEVALREVTRGGHAWVRENLRIPFPLMLLAAALFASLSLHTVWPLVAWIAILLGQYCRFVISELRVVKSIKWSLLGALRRFVCKPPQLAGQFLFLFRRLTGVGRGHIIEYDTCSSELDRPGYKDPEELPQGPPAAHDARSGLEVHRGKVAVDNQVFESRKLYETWNAQYYDSRQTQFYDETLRRIVQGLGLSRGDEVLDIGCGPGAHALRLAGMGLRVVAADVSRTALALAEEAVKDAGLQEQFTVCQQDITHLNFPDGRFQAVLCWGVLMHVSDIARAVAELSRVLQLGGRLALGVNNGSSLDALLVMAFRTSVRRRVESHWELFGRCRYYGTPSGPLLVRDIRVPHLIHHASSVGLRCLERRAGQLTELHSRVRTPWLRDIFARVNTIWSRHIAWPSIAQNNILIFEKYAAAGRNH